MQLKHEEISQLVSLPNVQVDLVHAGDASPLATGTLTLSLISFQLPSHPPPLPPRTPSSSSLSASAPPLPPRSKSPLPPPPAASPYSTDSWLILSLNNPGDPEPLLELPIAATTRIVSIPPRSFLVRASLNGFPLPNANGKERQADATVGIDDDEHDDNFLRLTLSASTDSGDREVFENALWSLTSFSSSAPPAQPSQRGGDAYCEDHDLRSRLVLIDEENGSVLGELSNTLDVSEDPSLAKEHQGEHEKEPVVIDFSQTSTSSSTGLPSGLVTVSPVSAWKDTPNPSGSTIIYLGDFVGRGIVFGAEAVSKGLVYGADLVVKKTKPVETPLVFSPRTKKTIEGGNNLTAGAVKISSKTVGMIGELAAGFGDRAGKALGIQSTPSGKPPTGIRGLVNKSLIAFNTVVDSIETGGQTLLAAGANSSTAVVEHRLGPEAAGVSRRIGGSVKHVALVYIDARGVTRRALLKTVGRSALRAKLADGREVILENDGSLGSAEFGPKDPELPGYGSSTMSVAEGKQKEKGSKAD